MSPGALVMRCETMAGLEGLSTQGIIDSTLGVGCDVAPASALF